MVIDCPFCINGKLITTYIHPVVREGMYCPILACDCCREEFVLDPDGNIHYAPIITHETEE